jgi:hypothetical protein
VGIGFRKEFVFQCGGLPVVYQPRGRLSDLIDSAHWRHVDFELSGGIDYTWQREWRVPTKEFRFEREDVILVIPDVTEFVEELWHCSIDVEYEDGELTYYGGIFTNWDFIRVGTRGHLRRRRH